MAFSEGSHRRRAACTCRGVSPVARAAERAGTRLVTGGYMLDEHRGYFAGIERDIQSWGLADEFHYSGAPDRAAKIALLQKMDVFSMPATYAEPKGFTLIEAMANGVPVVQPERGAFTEIVRNTGGGILVKPDDAASLADGLLALLTGRARAADLGRAGAEGVRRHTPSSTWRNGRVGVQGVRSQSSKCEADGLNDVLTATSLSKHYPTPRARGCAAGRLVEVDRGESVAIMGPSAAGRARSSTCWRARSAIVGTVTIDGTNPYASESASRRRSGRIH